MKHKDHSKFKINDVDLEMKSVGDDGTFSGYGSVFGNEDFGGDIVVKGAFVESIKQMKSSGRPLPILWMHDPREPIGFFTSVSEDEKGLKVEGKLLIETVARAKEIYSLMKANVITGLSIGYRTIEDRYDRDKNVRYLEKLELKEISFVTFPMNDEARTDDVRVKLAHGCMPTMREFESFLRDSGFSKHQSVIAASKGYGALLQRESEDPMAELASGLQGLLEKL